MLGQSMRRRVRRVIRSDCPSVRGGVARDRVQNLAGLWGRRDVPDGSVPMQDESFTIIVVAAHRPTIRLTRTGNGRKNIVLVGCRVRRRNNGPRVAVPVLDQRLVESAASERGRPL